MFGRRSTPLLACQILHTLPGRVRLGCKALEFLPEQDGEIEERLEASEAILSAWVTPITGNALICYDITRITESDVVELAESVISTYSLVAYKAKRQQEYNLTVNERRIQEAPISEMLGRVAATSLTLLWVWFRRGQEACRHPSLVDSLPFPH